MIKNDEILIDETRKFILARIDEILRQKKISYDELKEGADISSIVYQWTNRSKNPSRNPSLTSIIKICNYFGISLAYFFSNDSSERNSAKHAELSKLTEQLDDEQLDGLIYLTKIMIKNKKD